MFGYDQLGGGLGSAGTKKEKCDVWKDQRYDMHRHPLSSIRRFTPDAQIGAWQPVRRMINLRHKTLDYNSGPSLGAFVFVKRAFQNIGRDLRALW